MKVHIKDGAHKESESTGGTKNYWKQKGGNDKKQWRRLEFVPTGKNKDLVYLNLESVRESICIYIYLWVLLCFNFKIEQRKCLSAIGSAAPLALCFHWSSPGAESLSNLVWEEPLELVCSYLPLQAGLSTAGGPDLSPAKIWISL